MNAVRAEGSSPLSIPDRIQKVHQCICGSVYRITELASALKVNVPNDVPDSIRQRLIKNKRPFERIFHSLESAIKLHFFVEKNFDTNLARYFATGYLELSKASHKIAPPAFWGWYGYSLDKGPPSFHAAAHYWVRRSLLSLTQWLIDATFPYNVKTYDAAIVEANILEFEAEVDEWCDDVLATSEEAIAELALLGMEVVQTQLLWKGVPKLSGSLVTRSIIARFLDGDEDRTPEDKLDRILVNLNDDRDRFAYERSAAGDTDQQISLELLSKFGVEIGARGVGAAVKRYAERNKLPVIEKTRGRKARKTRKP
jgi:hypothetical protein